jgi:hypothetical protein
MGFPIQDFFVEADIHEPWSGVAAATAFASSGIRTIPV